MITTSKILEKLTQITCFSLVQAPIQDMCNMSSQVTRIQDIQFTPKKTKFLLIEALCEDIGQLFIGTHMTQSDISFSFVVSQEVMSYVNVLGS